MTIKRSLFSDETQSIDDRVMSLLEQMTLDEKLAQLVGIWVTELLDENREFQEAQSRAHLAQGIGHITRVAAASLLEPQDSARLANRIQKFLLEHTRLGIPAIVHEESCAGYMARGATTFPQAIGLGATWEPDLIGQMAVVIRQQMRAAGAHQTLAPVLDVARDPRWGRIEETYGEDPFLISSLGTSYVKAIQTEDLRSGIAATAKHFVAHSLPEGGMNWAPVHVGERELREMFLTPFKAVIQVGGIASVMNAYHELDGVPCGSSRELMVDLLRGELGFDGVVSSDYFTLRTLMSYHHVARDEAEAARLGLEAGIDIELPSRDCYGEPLRQGLVNGDIDMALVDTAVKRILRMKFQLGLFENPYVNDEKVVEIFNTDGQRELSRRIAQKSMVLLKNDGLLPLSKNLKAVAVIGSSADSVRLMQGDYHYPSHLEHIFDQHTSENAPNPQQQTSVMDWNGHFPPSVTVLAGIRATVSTQTEIRYARGCEVNRDATSGFSEAVAAAAGADVAIVVVGDKSGLGRDCTVGETLDSADLRLPGAQQALLEAIHATGTPVVAVFMTGRPYNLTWAAEHVPALIEAWLPAQEGGTAVADILFGNVSPGGKLPVSFPRSVGQVPVYYNHKPSGGRTNWQENYTDMSTKPLFPFGHGLSYTDFSYSDLTLSHRQVAPTGAITISVRVENTGQYTGDEVAQLYVADPVASVTRPVKMLKGFKRFTLQPGEAQTVYFELDVRHLAFYNTQMEYVVEPGEIQVMIGSSSEDIRLNDTFEIVGETTPVEQVFFTSVHME